MHTEHFLFFTQMIQKEYAFLHDDDAHHAHSVLRLNTGEQAQFTDGRGTLYTGQIESISRDRVDLFILERKKVPTQTPPVELFSGIPDKSAFERLIELVVPLGVSSITPTVCQFCQKPWWKSRWEKSCERLEKKMIVGLKQSKSLFLPQLHAPKSFQDALHSAPSDSTHVVASPQGESGLSLHTALQCSTPIICWVGPPGGFSDAEVAELSGNSFKQMWLSPNRLRTELAAAITIANVIQCITFNQKQLS